MLHYDERRPTVAVAILSVWIFQQSALAPVRSDLYAADLSLSRKRELFELAGTYASIVLALWTTDAIQKVFIGAALLWVALCVIRSRRNARASGLSAAGLRESMWVVLVALAVAMGLILASSSMHTLHIVVRRHPAVLSIGGYSLWALLQEFILVNVFLSR